MKWIRVGAKATIVGTHVSWLVPLVLGCGAEHRNSATNESERGISAPTLTVRIPDGEIARATLLGDSRLLVQVDQDRLFLYRRVDGQRIPLVSTERTRERPAMLLWAQGLPDGTVAAHDFRSGELTVFDTAGAVVRATPLRAATGTPVPLAAFRGGGMIVLRDFLPSPYAQETGGYTDTTVLMPISADAQPIGQEIPVAMGRRFGVLDDERASDEPSPRRRTIGIVGAGVFDGKGRHSIRVPLSPQTMIAAASDGIYLGSSDSTQIRFLDPAGRELNHFQVFSLDEHQPQHWVVYARDGTRVGSTTLPAGSRLLDASDGELLVARQGTAGGEILQVIGYRLH